MQAVSMHSEWRMMGVTCIFAFGAIVYLILPFELPLTLLIVSTLTVVGLQLFSKQLHVKHLLTVCLILLCGTLASKYRNESLLAPKLDQVERFYPVEATISFVERRPNQAPRLYLSNISKLGRYNADQIPLKLQVSVRTDLPDIAAGDTVKLNAVLKGPARPIFYGAFDFSRQAWFRQVGGSGYAVSDVELIHKGARSSFAIQIENIRNTIASRLIIALGPEQGGLAAALLVGRRDLLTKQTVDTMREVGLAHILAISGLHMGLVTGFVFFILEALFALIPAIALYILPRKIAAVGAIVAAVSYLLLSGMSTSTIRAFLMVTVALLAILIDRRAISLRSVALAAFLIILIQPESILSAGFQMSFAATAALIVFYEWLIGRKGQFKPHEPMGPIFKFGRKLVIFFAMTTMTTIIAQAAIAPISLYHFHSLSIIGVFANLAAMPILALVVMPLGLLTLLLIPFGLEAITAPLLSYALEIILNVGNEFASWPMTTWSLGAITDLFFIIAICGLLIFFIIRPLWLGGAIYALSLVSMMTYGRMDLPDFIFFENGKSFIQYSQGDNAILGGVRGSGYVARMALELSTDSAPDSALRQCGPSGCLYTLSEGVQIYSLLDSDSIEEDCAAADIVLAGKNISQACKKAAKFNNSLMITDRDFSKFGAHSVWRNEDGSYRIKTSTNNKENRYWSYGY